MGRTFVHYLAPRDLEWVPPADLARRLDLSLRGGGWVHGHATIYEADTDDLRFADAVDVELSGEASVRWIVEDAVRALGDVPVEVRLDTGPSLKAMDPTILHEAASIEAAEGERLVDGRDTVVGWDRIDWHSVPGLRAPSLTGVPSGRFGGVFRARLTLDYEKRLPVFSGVEPTQLPLEGRRRLEAVFGVELVEASDFGG